MKPKIFALVLFLLLLVSLSQMLSEAQAFAQYVDTAWVRRYNGGGNWYDRAYAIAVDGSGNVYVTGESPDTAATDRAYATIKYYSNGDTAWARTYNGPGNSIDTASAIAVDRSGNVYVTGMSYGAGTSADYATIKYYPDGDTAWVRRYNGPANDYDYACAIAIDDSGNVYVTGGSYDTLTYRDYATIKYKSNGDTVWVRRYNGPGNGNDQAYALLVDDSGNVYVTGGSYNNGTYDDYATIKYKPDGDTAWVRRYDGPQNVYDDAFAIAVDDFGNVYVTGASYGNGTYNDYATIKYYPDGDTAWVRRYNGPGNSNDLAHAMAVDDYGNVYVTGWSYDNGTGYDYATIKYGPNGNELWMRRYCGPGSSYDWACAIALDNSNNVYVTGGSDQSSTIPYNSDYATVKYYSNGDTAWVRRYNGPANDYDYAYAIAVDGSNNVYVTGTSWGTGTYLDYATIKYVQFLCGDANGDGVINIADIVYLINYQFIGGPAPVPLEAGDANCDGVVNSADIVYLINYQFVGGPPPGC